MTNTQTFLTTADIARIYNNGYEQAEVLTKDMAAIFAKHPECEAPEFMPEPYLSEWNLLHQIQRNLFDRITRLESAVNSLDNYIKMEVQ